MPPERATQRLKDYLISQGIDCEGGLSEDRLTDFERRHGVRLPDDLRNYLVTINVPTGAYGYGMIRFWNLDEIKPIRDIVDSTPPDGSVIKRSYSETIHAWKDYFVFADYWYDLQLYMIHLSAAVDNPNDVVLFDGAAPVKVADSFSHFVDLYLTSPESLRLTVD